MKITPTINVYCIDAHHDPIFRDFVNARVIKKKPTQKNFGYSDMAVQMSVITGFVVITAMFFLQLVA
jgi:hypothetical protein